MYILGLHNDEGSGVALIQGGRILDAVSEERFNRVKLTRRLIAAVRGNPEAGPILAKRIDVEFARDAETRAEFGAWIAAKGCLVAYVTFLDHHAATVEGRFPARRSNRPSSLPSTVAARRRTAGGGRHPQRRLLPRGQGLL
jgi:hypothetical protein